MFEYRRVLSQDGATWPPEAAVMSRNLGITVKWPSCNNPRRSAVLAVTNAALWPGQRQIHHFSHRLNVATSQSRQTSQHFDTQFPKRNFKRKEKSYFVDCFKCEIPPNIKWLSGGSFILITTKSPSQENSIERAELDISADRPVMETIRGSILLPTLKAFDQSTK